MVKNYFLVIFSGILSAFSQVLLKKSSLVVQRSAVKKVRPFLSEYLNARVLIAYLITGACMLLMIAAYRGLPYKVGSVLETLSYVFVMLFSRLFLGERITPKRLAGNLLVCAGVIIFTLG